MNIPEYGGMDRETRTGTCILELATWDLEPRTRDLRPKIQVLEFQLEHWLIKIFTPNFSMNF